MQTKVKIFAFCRQRVNITIFAIWNVCDIMYTVPFLGFFGKLVVYFVYNIPEVSPWLVQR